MTTKAPNLYRFEAFVVCLDSECPRGDLNPHVR